MYERAVNKIIFCTSLGDEHPTREWGPKCKLVARDETRSASSRRPATDALQSATTRTGELDDLAVLMITVTLLAQDAQARTRRDFDSRPGADSGGPDGQLLRFWREGAHDHRTKNAFARDEVSKIALVGEPFPASWRTMAP